MKICWWQQCSSAKYSLCLSLTVCFCLSIVLSEYSIREGSLEGRQGKNTEVPSHWGRLHPDRWALHLCRRVFVSLSSTPISTICPAQFTQLALGPFQCPHASIILLRHPLLVPHLSPHETIFLFAKTGPPLTQIHLTRLARSIKAEISFRHCDVRRATTANLMFSWLERIQNSCNYLATNLSLLLCLSLRTLETPARTAKRKGEEEMACKLDGVEELHDLCEPGIINLLTKQNVSSP